MANDPRRPTPSFLSTLGRAALVFLNGINQMICEFSEDMRIRNEEAQRYADARQKREREAIAKAHRSVPPRRNEPQENNQVTVVYVDNRARDDVDEDDGYTPGLFEGTVPSSLPGWRVR